VVTKIILAVNRRKGPARTNYHSRRRRRPNFEARAGFFVTVAAVMLLYGWGWLKGLSIFHPPQRFTVAFHDIEGLNTNAPVNTNGYRVGIAEKSN